MNEIDNQDSLMRKELIEQEKGFVSEAAANGQHKVFGRKQMEYNERANLDGVFDLSFLS